MSFLTHIGATSLPKACTIIVIFPGYNLSYNLHLHLITHSFIDILDLTVKFIYLHTFLYLCYYTLLLFLPISYSKSSMDMKTHNNKYQRRSVLGNRRHVGGRKMSNLNFEGVLEIKNNECRGQNHLRVQQHRKTSISNILNKIENIIAIIKK